MLQPVIEKLYKQFWRRLKRQRNVVGFDGTLRPKERDGYIHKNWLTWRIYVETKLPEPYLRKKDIIPKSLTVPKSSKWNINTDIIAIGKPVIPPLLGIPRTTLEPWELKSTKDEWRPIEAGISSCHENCTACTLDAFFLLKDPAIEELLQASNYHCYGLEGDAKRGDVIQQPSPYDKGTVPKHKTGEYVFGVPITFDKYTCSVRNFFARKLAFWTWFKPVAGENDVDISFATVDVDWKNKIAREGMGFQGFANPIEGDPVAKCGRTTDRTQGVWESTSVFINVKYRRGIAFMTDIAMANIQSAGGDSGSPMYHPETIFYNAALFAGSQQGKTFGCKIENILKRAPVILVIK